MSIRIILAQKIIRSYHPCRDPNNLADGSVYAVRRALRALLGGHTHAQATVLHRKGDSRDPHGRRGVARNADGAGWPMPTEQEHDVPPQGMARSINFEHGLLTIPFPVGR